MKHHQTEIHQAIDVLQANLSHVARVVEWSNIMGFDHPQKFAYKFLRHYQVRPLKVLDYMRLKSIIHQLRSDRRYSNLEIALAHSLPDEKALNNFTNYHLGVPPRRLKSMSEAELKRSFQKFGNKIQEQI
ncbi:hypothetical protein QLX67_11960 [Balneolaceae bacterium ANBcel3]|nr:hypothetical protein [Balneolaceae bacterium ANBcel3]